MLRLWKFMFVSYGTLKYCVAHRYVLQSVTFTFTSTANSNFNCSEK